MINDLFHVSDPCACHQNIVIFSNSLEFSDYSSISETSESSSSSASTVILDEVPNKNQRNENHLPSLLNRLEQSLVISGRILISV